MNRKAMLANLALALAAAAGLWLVDASLPLRVGEVAVFFFCTAIAVFSFSGKHFTGDALADHIGFSFFLIAIPEAFFYFRCGWAASDGRFFRPDNIFFWVSACWYQAFAFLVLLRSKLKGFSAGSVLIAYAAVTILLGAVYFLIPFFARIVPGPSATVYRALNAIGFTLFYGILFFSLGKRTSPLPETFRKMLRAGALVSYLSAVLGLLLLFSGQNSMILVEFARYASLYLCYSAAVSYTLLDPYRNVYRALSERSIQLEEKNRGLQKAVSEREVLLKEIHHRVKNNLQIVSSLLSLQSNETEEPEARASLEKSRQRIFAMASVHEMLYSHDDFERINLSEYLRGITNAFAESSPRVSVQFESDCPNYISGIDAAIHCGLIVTELIGNALKHAFPDGRRGRIVVSVGTEPRANVLVSVSDDGVGFHDSTAERTADSLGMVLVRTLTDQLGGELTLTGTGGTRAELRFPC